MADFQFQRTIATEKLFAIRKKIRDIRGGTGAGKTVGITIWDIDYAWITEKKVIDVVSESYPHLEQGVMRDFKNIMIDRGYWDDNCWHESKHKYTFPKGTTIQFQSYDKLGKAHGPRRDVLHLNEANWLPWDVVNQLIVRTRDVVWAEYNPSNEFWMHTEVIGKRDDVESLKLTYLDNKHFQTDKWVLSESEIKEIESRKNNPRWWRVYGEGELGEAEGRLYTGWQIIEEIPHEARLERHGLDFGWNPDPVALIDIYYYNGGYILDEVLYGLEIPNSQVASTIKNLPSALTIADSAEPKSIAEIKRYGINIIGADKGADSKRYGIKTLQGLRISVTQRSINLIKEYRNYYQLIDRRTNQAIMGETDGADHCLDACFAPETLIYTTKGNKPIKDLIDKSGFLYSIGGQIKRFYNVRPTRKNAETLKIEFMDGEILEITPDHRLLNEKGLWISADCIIPLDRIQSAMYGNNNLIYKTAKFQWQKILSYWKIFYQFKAKAEILASGGMDILFWRNTKWLSYTSQGQEQSEQSDRKPGIETERSSFERTLDIREEKTGENTRRENKTLNQEVAQIKRGIEMAQDTRDSGIQKKETLGEKLRSLPYEIYNFAIRQTSKILPPELQNESQTKTIKRITRGFCPQTYNLEVEDTHCLLANGVIAHNSRYGLCSLIPIKQRQEMRRELGKQQWQMNQQQNPV